MWIIKPEVVYRYSYLSNSTGQTERQNVDQHIRITLTEAHKLEHFTTC